MKQTRNKHKRSNPDKNLNRRSKDSSSRCRTPESDSDRKIDRDQAQLKRNIDNDISWYSRYPSLLEATARISFPYRPGMQVPLYTTDPQVLELEGAVAAKFDGYNLPGVLAIDWIPSVGLSTGSPLDPASQIGRELYARVREAYSADLDADGPDMFVYLQALDGVFSYIAWLKRVYRTLNAWSPTNYATPRNLLHAYGLSDALIADLRTHRVDLYGHINDLIYQSRTFKVPAVFDVMNRHYWLNDNVYLDADSVEGQFYVFNQNAWYTFALQNVTGGVASGCELLNSPVNGSNVAATERELYTYGLDLLSALYEWTTARTINGYFRRVFEDAANFAVEELRQDEVLEPVYSEEVLMQIENVRAVLPFNSQFVYMPDLTGMTISQNPKTNVVLCNNELRFSGAPLTMADRNISVVQPALNIRASVPTVAEIVVASRMQPTFYSVGAGTAPNQSTIITIDSGTEIPLRLRITDAQSTSSVLGVGFPNFLDYAGLSAPDGVTPAEFAMLESWDWHPIQYEVFAYGDSRFLVPRGDIRNFTQLTAEDMGHIHRVCLLSEYNAYSIT